MSKTVKKKATKTKEIVTAAPVEIAYKAFTKDFAGYGGFKFEVGKEYEAQGEIKACGNGFHTCENPFDTLDYHPLVDSDGNTSRFGIAEVSGDCHVEGNKKAHRRIKVTAEIGLAGFLKAGIDFLFQQSEHKTIIEKIKDVATGADVEASSGYNAKQASSGDNAQQASSGDNAKQASSGNYAKQASSGYNAQQEITGDFGVLSSVHARGKFKAKAGTLVSLVFFDKDEKTPIKFVTGKVGENGLNPDTWYDLDAKGEFREVV